jgi:hypothetical protein
VNLIDSNKELVKLLTSKGTISQFLCRACGYPGERTSSESVTVGDEEEMDESDSSVSTVITSVRTHLGDLSSGGRFHERATQHLQGVGPNVISRFNNGLSVF